MDDIEEEWKDVVNYEGYYQVSNLGRIKSLDRVIVDKNGVEMQIPSIIKKLQKSKTGYWCIELWRHNKLKYVKVHRLIADAFIPNPENKPQVNHIDSNRLNNDISNLEWCTPSENTIHAVRLGRIKSPMVGMKGLFTARNKPVIQLSISGVILKEFMSQTAAAIELGLSPTNISACVNGKTKTCGGFKWINKESDE